MGRYQERVKKEPAAERDFLLESAGQSLVES